MSKPILFDTISRAKFDALTDAQKSKKNYHIKEVDGTTKKYIGNLIGVGSGSDSGTEGTPNEKAKAIKSWADVKAAVQNGSAKEIFNVGDYFLCNYGEDGRELAWVIIGFDQDGDNSMTLQTLEPICPMDFSPREHLFVNNGTAALNTGTYHFGYNNTNYQFVTTKIIPVNGYIDLNNTTVTTFDAEGTQLESLTATSGASATQGTELTVNTYASYNNRKNYGSTRYKVSQVRAFLNGDETDLNPFIVPSERYKTETKFTEAIDPEFLAVVSPVTKKTKRYESIDGEGFDELTDKFFLLAESEVFGKEDEGEGEAYQFFSQNSMFSEPTTDNDKCRMRLWYYWWLRSFYNADNVRRVNNCGDVGNYFANYGSNCVRPAAVIK